MRSVDGLDTEKTLARSISISVGQVSLSIVALEDLIANKRASGRPQDLADVDMLERVRGAAD